MSSADGSPVTTPSSTPLSGHTPKYGTVIPSRIFVGGIAANTTDAELKQYFAAYGAVKDTKIITDRAGVSKGYGFVTFESQEDADRIIKKESDNLIFKDRKLNIGPAVRKQGIQRSYDTTLYPGALAVNGVPYTYQNGMAIFQSTDGNYPIVQSQQPYASTALMIPQNQLAYMTPQYPYQQSLQSMQSLPSMPSIPGMQSIQGMQSSLQPVPSNTGGYIWATMPSTTDLVYQTPQTYQSAELTDAAFIDGATVEGNVIPVEQSLASRIHSPVSEVNTSDQTTLPTVIPVQASTKNAISYKKHYITRRSYNSPTILVKNGNKVQRLMVPGTSPPTVNYGQILPCNPTDTGDGNDTYIRYTLPGHSTK